VVNDVKLRHQHDQGRLWFKIKKLTKLLNLIHLCRYLKITLYETSLYVI